MHSRVLFKCVGAVTLILLLSIFVISWLHGVSFRDFAMAMGKTELKMGYKDYLERGYVTNYGNSGYQIWLSTNVASIGGTQYQCFITVRDYNFYEQGTLGMTTNQVLIWLDAERPPKIIDRDYRAPLLSPRF